MELKAYQPNIPPTVDPLRTPAKIGSQEIISLEECRQYVGAFQLSDERISEIRNNMIGIVDQVINTYLRNFE